MRVIAAFGALGAAFSLPRHCKAGCEDGIFLDLPFAPMTVRGPVTAVPLSQIALSVLPVALMACFSALLVLDRGVREFLIVVGCSLLYAFMIAVQLWLKEARPASEAGAGGSCAESCGLPADSAVLASFVVVWIVAYNMKALRGRAATRREYGAKKNSTLS